MPFPFYSVDLGLVRFDQLYRGVNWHIKMFDNYIKIRIRLHTNYIQ